MNKDQNILFVSELRLRMRNYRMDMKNKGLSS
jgi:hypothetical protein